MWTDYMSGYLQRAVSTTDAAIWRTYQRQLAANITKTPAKFLRLANEARKKYAAGTGTPYTPLVWSPQLAEGAQNYANCCPKQHSMPLWNQPFAEGLFSGGMTAAVRGMIAEIEAPSCTDNYTKTITSASSCGHGSILLLASTAACGFNPDCKSVVCRYGTDYGLPSGNLYVYDRNCCNLYPQWYKTWLTYDKSAMQYSTQHAIQQPDTCVSNGADRDKNANAPYPSPRADTSRITASWPPVPSNPTSAA
jgi:hypothetical protein